MIELLPVDLRGKKITSCSLDSLKTMWSFKSSVFYRSTAGNCLLAPALLKVSEKTRQND